VRFHKPELLVGLAGDTRELIGRDGVVSRQGFLDVGPRRVGAKRQRGSVRRSRATCPRLEVEVIGEALIQDHPHGRARVGGQVDACGSGS
jgi:hypothetical protein